MRSFSLFLLLLATSNAHAYSSEVQDLCSEAQDHGRENEIVLWQQYESSNWSYQVANREEDCEFRSRLNWSLSLSAYSSRVVEPYFWDSFCALRLPQDQLATHFSRKPDPKNAWVPRLNEMDMSEIDEDELSEKVKKFSPLACLEFEKDPSVLTNCMRGVRALAKYFGNDRTQGGEVPSYRVFQQVLKTPSLQNLLLEFTAESIDAVKDPNSRMVFWDRLSKAAEKHFPDPKARDSAMWAIVAMLNSRGLNTDLVDFQQIVPDLEAGMQTDLSLSYSALPIAELVLNLRFGASEGPLYSYPKSVQTSCDSRKPYHFWYAAYLTQWLIREQGISPDGARLAAFLVNVGYQMLVRSPITLAEPFSTGRTHPSARKTVMDFIYAAAGAEFGAHPERNLDLDPIFQREFKRAGEYRVIPADEAEARLLDIVGKRKGYARNLLWLKRSYYRLFDPVGISKAVFRCTDSPGR